MVHEAPHLSQQEKAKQFYDLHHSGRLLMLPNIWDCLGANLLEQLGYPAIATASAAVAFTNGYDDGEHIPFDYLLLLLKKIVNSVNVPVSADVESGFADNNLQLKENVKRIVETGVVGINIEDVNKETNELWPIEVQCEKIRVIKEVSGEMGAGLFVNARSDVYIRGKGFDTAESKLDETLKRGRAYKEAGADCFYPITLSNKEDLIKLVRHIQMPVNVLLMPGIPGLAELQEIGIARVSLGPGFLKIAIRAMKNLAVKLHQLDGAEEVKANEISSAYIKDLVNKNY